jgi:hypothetical protein
MHLVTDEVIRMPIALQNSNKARLRIWRAKGVPAVILVSQIPTQIPPDFATTKLANWLYQAYLRCDPKGFSYWEYLGGDGCENVGLFCIFFDELGLPSRRRFLKPFRKYYKPERLEALIGEHIEM